MTATVRFGLIGCGMIARLHAGAIREIPGAELGGAFDPVPGRAEAFMVDIEIPSLTQHMSG